MGWAEIGAHVAAPGSEVQDKFLKIRSQADRASGLTRQLLAFARRQTLQPCNTDLNELARETISLLRNVIGERIEIHLELEDDLHVIWADPGQVEQVLMNLSLNARDAMPSGGRLIVETKNAVVDADYQRSHPYALPGNYVLLRVRDTGVGMDTETLAHIFEPFFTTKEIGRGTGLGLATVYGIVKQHRGFIDVDTAPGKGTAFRVYLPLGNGPAQGTEKAAVFTMSGEELAVAETSYREMKQRIESMGAVNMMALEEFNECEQRFTFLTRERDDLLQSIADTQQAIAELDLISKEKFEQAFNAINANFSTAFHAIFGGGMV